MIRSGLVALGLMVLGVSTLNDQASAAEIEAPEVGDPVVVYTHKFKPSEFEAGKKLVIEGFSEAMRDHGEERLTFFMVDQDASEVVAVSIFKNNASVEKWHDAVTRLKVLEDLEALRRQPLILQEFRLEKIHVVDR